MGTQRCYQRFYGLYGTMGNPNRRTTLTPCEEHNHPTDLKRQNTKFQYFVEGLHKDQPKFKKERMFLQLLEGIHPKDALVVIDMINKNKPKGITRGIVEKAFPSLLQD